MVVLLIPGTWGWDGGPFDTTPLVQRPPRWHEKGSPLVALLQHRGHTIVGLDGRPFVWSTDLGGLGFGMRDHRVWQAAGLNLLERLRPAACDACRHGWFQRSDINIISHSYGLNVALYAAAAGLEINTLIDVCGPFRYDMQAVAEKAKPNIRSWIHYSNHGDVLPLFSGLFDTGNPWRWFHNHRDQPLADRNMEVPQLGHSHLLNEEALVPVVVSALEEYGLTRELIVC